jgi:hypothetical protein
MMMLGMPKKGVKDYVLASLSAIGSLLCAYSALVGPQTAYYPPPLLPASYVVNFGIVMGLLYGLGFLIVPKILINMNFEVYSVDPYHEFFGRFCGTMMMILCYILYALSGQNPILCDGLSSYTLICIWFTATGLVGPTFAAIMLTPKQTLMGHLPAHILFLVAGLLALGATMKHPLA